MKKNINKSTDFDDLLSKIPEDKKIIGEKLIRELIFLDETMTELKKQIKEYGTIEHFEQGKQNFLRESPALKSYNTTVQRYSMIFRQLTDMIGKTQEAEKINPVYDFIKEGLSDE